MDKISLPDKYDVKKIGPNQAEIIIEPFYPGYGNTLGNALRRVLLSSLPGAAITAVTIKNISHEFSTIPGIKEDVIELILNLKKVRFILHDTEEVKVILKVKGERKVKAKDITVTSNIEIASPEAEIATLNDKNSELEIELIVRTGRGYLPVENIEKKKFQLGTIAIDAIFTPVKNVNFKVEDVRVGQMTNYDKLILSITTDGILAPEEALRISANILVDQFSQIEVLGSDKPAKTVKVKKEDETPDLVKDESKKEVVVDDAKTEKKEDDDKPKKKRGRPKKVVK